MILGLSVPIMLRRQEAGRFEVVGVAYVHSIMNWEVLDIERRQKSLITVRDPRV